MRKRILFLVTGLCFTLLVCAQSNKKIKELEGKRSELQKQISQSEMLLRSTKKDVSSQLSNLALLNSQIAERKKYIAVIENDVEAVKGEIRLVERQLAALEKDLADKRKKYESSVQYMYKNKSVQEKLMFIFSAEKLSQIYRRLRYVREYATYQRIQGEEIQRKQEQISVKKKELMQVRNEKTELLRQGVNERTKLENQEKDRKTILTGLQKKQKGIQNEIRQKRKQAEKLNAQIDRLIEIEIAKARKRAEEEARREAEARKKAEAEAAARAAKPETGAASKSSAGSNTSKTTKSAPVERFTMDKADRQLSGSFERNQGALPMPISGPYMIVSHYGQYSVEGLKNVKLDNKGIDIRGKAGATARAIFDGEVSAIFQYNGLVGVLVRHGNYISVYCNLSSVSVGKGDKVKTKDTIGKVYTDDSGNTVLHFQLRKETSKLNPEVWLNR